MKINLKKIKATFVIFITLVSIFLILGINNSKVSGQTNPFASEPESDCKCPDKNRLENGMCIKSPDNIACILLYAPVCGCDGMTYSNGCFADAAGIKKYTQGKCLSSGSGTSCITDNDCPEGVCLNGQTYMAFSCLDGSCRELNFFADPCQFLSSSGNITPSLNKNFSGVWKGRILDCSTKEIPVRKLSQISECIICPQIQILCAPEFITVPESCTECTHCQRCKTIRSFVLRLCVRDGKLEGNIRFTRLSGNFTITAYEVLSENEVSITVENEKGETYTISLSLAGEKLLNGSFSDGELLEAKKIGLIRSCQTQNTCPNCDLVRCANSGIPPNGCKKVRPIVNSCKSCCEQIVCSSSGGFSDCASRGNCRGENGSYLSCPTGTECSGLPAYGCYPPGCPVPLCLSPDTRIKTPGIQKRIADIMVGDKVITETGEIVKVKETVQVEAKKHKILKVTFNDTTVLEVSPGHPIGDGEEFNDLRVGSYLDGRMVISIKKVPYNYKYTYDILPDSKSGKYYANGILVGSTLK